MFTVTYEVTLTSLGVFGGIHLLRLTCFFSVDFVSKANHLDSDDDDHWETECRQMCDPQWPLAVLQMAVSGSSDNHFRSPHLHGDSFLKESVSELSEYQCWTMLWFQYTGNLLWLWRSRSTVCSICLNFTSDKRQGSSTHYFLNTVWTFMK